MKQGQTIYNMTSSKIALKILVTDSGNMCGVCSSYFCFVDVN
jgi:hypothetical protein